MNTLALTMPEAARNAGISRARLYQLIKAGLGPQTTKVGRRTIVLREDLESWLRSLRDNTKAAKGVA